MPQTPLLPGQPKSAIHTSQTATTNRAPTQTAAFQKEKKTHTAITVTNGYPGKKSAEEGRKKQIRKPSEYQNSKRINHKGETRVQLRY
jgi:hypothetical protein